MLPSNLIANFLSIIGEVTSPLVIAAKKPAFTYAASSTPGGTRSLINSSKNASSPAGGFFSNSTKSATCSGFRGFGGIPSAARSATCARYCSNTNDSSQVDTRRSQRTASNLENGGIIREIVAVLNLSRSDKGYFSHSRNL